VLGEKGEPAQLFVLFLRQRHTGMVTDGPVR
jgi:hypothetical protein